jgi:hypothetical protein
MATIEDKVWGEIVAPHLAASPQDALPKAKQQSLATALQQWAATCITDYLRRILVHQGRTDVLKHLAKPSWQVLHRGKDFLGAVRWQEVDVWMTNPEAGLVLAVDPKHFQSMESFKKNWKNGHNDLVAFASNLHERFPLCAVGGIICFPEWAADAAGLKQVQGICGRSIPRERPLNAYGKFEGFGIAVYNKSAKLIWPFAATSALKPSAAFHSLAYAVCTRTASLL